MRHVLEHLPEPREALQRLRAVLAPGGTLYLGTPDARALSAKVFGRYWHGWDPPRHAVVFTSTGLRGLLEDTGFRVLDERWDFAPQMWSASLAYALTYGAKRPRAARGATLVNPFVGVPAGFGALAELATRRSTMYGVTAVAA